MKIDLLIIDPQNDFCDPKGSLHVPGADTDMVRLSQMILGGKEKLDHLRVTLDSHHLIHIAHPIWWIDKEGKHPNPYTQIQLSDVTANGTQPLWRATNPHLHKQSIEYIEQLAKNARYPLFIWPPHCLIGSWGHSIYPQLFNSLKEWEDQFRIVDMVVKGSNITTEHYSAVKADVEDPEDPSTLINTEFIEQLEKADLIGIAGEALSHCVANTVRDIAKEFGDNQVKKFVLLEDATSSVPGFEQLGEDFVKEMVGKGMQVTQTKDFLS